MELTPLEQRLDLLMAMPTFSDNTSALQQAIESLGQELAAIGMSVEYFGQEHPLLLATTQATRQPKVLLAIHLDVVPESGAAICQMRVDGDKIIGRGCYDMKFAAACALEVAHNLAARGQLHDYDFGILLTTDEEVGGFEVEKLLRDEGVAPGLTILPDGGEGWSIESAAKGLLHGRLTAHGRSAHGSRPWEGDNALDHLLRAATELQTLAQNDNKDGTTISLGYLRAGKAINQIPDEAILRFDARSFAYEDLMKIDELCQDMMNRYPLTYAQEVFGYPVVMNEHHELTQQFMKVMTEFLGREVEFSKSYAATDGRWFAQFGLPMVILRLEGGGIHGPEEWIRRSDLPRFADLLEQFICST